jgi:hypothetical protein
MAAVTEEKLASKLAKVTERLQAGAEPGTAGHGRAIGARTHVAVPADGCMAF